MTVPTASGGLSGVARLRGAHVDVCACGGALLSSAVGTLRCPCTWFLPWVRTAWSFLACLGTLAESQPIFPPPPTLPAASSSSADVPETHAAYLKGFVTPHSGCQALTSSKHAPVSCLGKDQSALNLLITQLLRCLLAFPCCSALLVQPRGCLSILIPLCPCQDPPLLSIWRACLCQLSQTLSEQRGELIACR